MESLKLESFAEVEKSQAKLQKPSEVGKDPAKLETTERNWKEPSDVEKFLLELESFAAVGKFR